MPAQRPTLPDQFPTLEAAATLGFAILLWRTVLLARVADAEIAIVTRRLRGARARDLVALAVLLGATLYGVATELGPWFVSMCSGGAVLVIVGNVLRQRIAARNAGARAQGPGDRARGSDDSDAPSSSEACPRCGAGRLVALDCGRRIALHAVPTAPDESSELVTGISALEVCPRCGYLQGTAEDRQALIAESDIDEAGPTAAKKEQGQPRP
jgi:ribosomal protein S27AE